MDSFNFLTELFKGISIFTWGNLVMIFAGLVLIGLGIFKEYEPVLLVPIGFGCILANIPLNGLLDENGLLGILYRAGIETEIFPLLIFIGVGAMIDFSPLLAQPKLVLMGAAGQIGIFGTLLLAVLIGLHEHLKRHTLTLIPKKPSQIREQRETDPSGHDGKIRCTRTPVPTYYRKALVFHDSFGLVLRHFLKEPFQESLFVQEDDLDYALIKTEQPDIVIQEMGQRGMLGKLLDESSGIEP